VLLDDGTQEPFDRLVLATGAQAVVPTLAGLNPDPAAVHLLPPGVTALRDLEDATKLRAVVGSRGRIIVLGGGILGIEAALAAAEEGADVTVVHHGPHPLARNLDPGGGRMLAAALHNGGIRLASDVRSTAVAFRPRAGGRHQFDALVLEDGTELPGELLLLSCGVRARTELAAGCGLSVDKGILVNHRLEADVEGRIFAVGDCAQVACGDGGCAECSRGTTGPAGLIGPGWRQAEYVARLLLELTPQRHVAAAGGTTDETRPAPLAPEQPGVMLLKARTVDLASAGNISPELWDVCLPEPDASGSSPGSPPVQVAQWADPEHGQYAKMVTRAGVLEGLVCVGMPRTAAELVLLYERGAELPADRTALFRLDSVEEQDDRPSPADPDSTLCRCSGATLGGVEDAIAGGCGSIEEVSACTRAGTGCGGCKSRIEELIGAYASVAMWAGP
jgi:assimilatory nitrate reductase electron transfer subunit